MTKKQKQREKRFQGRSKKYGITLARHDKISKKQKHRCGICGRRASEFKHGLNIDHHHFRVEAFRCHKGGWKAYTVTNGILVRDQARTKVAAIAKVKKRALPLSVRGLLCPGRYSGCNRLLGRVDKIKWLEQTLGYLKNQPAAEFRGV